MLRPGWPAGRPYRWQVGDRSWVLDHTVVMGILNVTPDSFSDGGLWQELGRAVAHGLEMAQQGAEIIDVGGESTRPGAPPVPVDEEVRRVIPVITELRRQLPAGVEISVDTRKAKVARQAWDAGASIINDITGLTFDPGMVEVARQTGAGLVVMHMRGTPATMQQFTDYRDVTGEVASWLAGRVDELKEQGIEPVRIVIDPGFGFSKTAPQNLTLLRELGRLQQVGRPVLVGTSRKSTIGLVLGTAVDQRLEGTAATVALAIAGGADIVRVHDVAAMVRVARMADAVVRGWPTTY
ncbi:MAG: dihydropteroate synthase [Limnochordaceae bacterium]|nr:dihydropteroate synthase [Limnochordaceae bacterium]